MMHCFRGALSYSKCVCVCERNKILRKCFNCYCCCRHFLPHAHDLFVILASADTVVYIQMQILHNFQFIIRVLHLFNEMGKNAYKPCARCGNRQKKKNKKNRAHVPVLFCYLNFRIALSKLKFAHHKFRWECHSFIGI